MQAVTRTPQAFAKANGISLCYDTFGDVSSPALLLVMGLGGQMTAWDETFCSELAARGYHVIRFDNRDIGLSTRFDEAGPGNVAAAFGAAMEGKPVDSAYRLTDMAADAIALLDALGIEQAHVVGVSMGGAIVQTMAIEHPERLLSMTSIMATSGAPDLPPPTPAAMAVLMQPPATDWDSYVERYQQTWKVLRAGDFPQDEALDRQRAEKAWARGLSPAGVSRQLVAIIASGSRREALKTVRVPTLVLHGDVDPLVPMACGVDTAQSVPNAKMTVIAGMGHALPISMWPQLIDAIAAHAI